MIAVNLLPKEERSEEIRLGAPRLRFLIWVGVAVVMVLVVGGSLLYQELQAQALREELMIAEQENLHLRDQVAMVRQYEAQTEQLQARLDLVFGLSRDRTLSLRLMDALAGRVPEHLWLTRVQQSGGEGQLIEGVTFSNLTVAEFMTRLLEEEPYTAVDLTVTERAEIAGEAVIKFALTARLGP